MDDKSRKFISDSAIDMYDSLRKSIEQAGGNPHFFEKDKMMKMTVDELISSLCTNGIRFVYKSDVPSPLYSENFKLKEELKTQNKYVKELEETVNDLEDTLYERDEEIRILKEEINDFKLMIAQCHINSDNDKKEIDRLVSCIYKLEHSLAHSYTAEEVTEKIDKVVEATLKKIIVITMDSGYVLTVEEYRKNLQGNWKYNL